MSEIIALTHCLGLTVSPTTLRQLRHIIAAMLCVTGRVTTLGLSRWTDKGGSVRTLHRWMQTPIEWGAVLWTVVRFSTFVALWHHMRWAKNAGLLFISTRKDARSYRHLVQFVTKD